jgi:proteasome assembly chaperone (PAC2) family protein
MADSFALTHPWLVAVWPGMGHVAVNAGIYLLAKLGMTGFAEFEANDLFDIEQVEVKDGLVQPARRPRNRFFVWLDPHKRHDLVVFLGEAQPPAGRYAFCRQIAAFAQSQGIERVFTFAAMATRMHPDHESRVFAAATDRVNLEELKRLELTVMQEGNIGGLNGVLLGAAMELGLNGMCLLGEMPQIFAQVPFPKASQAILEVFTTIAGIELDLSELAEQARIVEEQLGEILSRIEDQYQGESGDEAGDQPSEGGGAESEIVSGSEAPAEPEPPRPRNRGRSAARVRIEELFTAAAKDRSKAVELKHELDRLGLFPEYEDRFLDLFKKPS